MSNQNQREIIGIKIRKIRTERNLSQQEVADLAGLDKPHISRIENGKYNVQLDTLAKIAEALNTRIDLITE